MNCETFGKAMTVTAALALASCGIDRAMPHEERPSATVTQPAEPSPRTFVLGLQLTPSGAIAEDSAADAFTRGNVVFLSVDVSGASTDQLIDVEWSDAHGHVLHQERRTVPPGPRHAAFSSGRT